MEGSKARMNYHSVARNANGMAYLRPARLLFLVDRWLRKRERMLLYCNTIGVSTKAVLTLLPERFMRFRDFILLQNSIQLDFNLV